MNEIEPVAANKTGTRIGQQSSSALSSQETGNGHHDIRQTRDTIFDVETIRPNQGIRIPLTSFPGFESGGTLQMTLEPNYLNIWIENSQRTDLLKKPSLSVVIPIYFEENLISELMRRVTQVMQNLSNRYDYEVLFVNDGSTDGSLAALTGFHKADPDHIKVINLSRNFGHQLAISAGLAFAKGDAVIVMDGDLQDPPEVIMRMVEEWEKGYQIVYGVRAQREGETFFKLMTAKLYYRLISSISEVDLPIDAGDFRLMDRKAVNELNRLPEKSRYIRGLVNWIGFSHKGVTYERDRRFAGETKYTFKKMLSFALDGITSFSEKPLHIAGYVSLVCVGLALVGCALIFFSYFWGAETFVRGWASTIVIVIALGAVQLFTLAIIGQYVGRVCREARNRPLYIVQDLYGLKPTDRRS